jgi:hypothetical protein
MRVVFFGWQKDAAGPNSSDERAATAPQPHPNLCVFAAEAKDTLGVIYLWAIRSFETCCHRLTWQQE